MSYSDCIAIATHNALEMDLPAGMMPLTITNEAALLGGFESDRIGCPAWD